jgi:sulfatase modifying factor 1
MGKDRTGSCCTPATAREKVTTSEQTQNPGLSSYIEAATPMISLPGGAFLMGTDYADGFPADGEGPVRSVSLSAFEVDQFPVTNADFAMFIETTGYRTEAEHFGWSFVFWSHIPEEKFSEIVADTAAQAPWWCKVPGAFWKQPEGPESNINDRLRHPVVHVSWNDAAAYAKWAWKTLPTEAQWEYAARGGLDQKLYPWGDELTPNGKHLCNVLQGQFPVQDTAEDGFAGTCPVDAFPANGYGVYSATGNVWEWCADWFHASHSSEGLLHDPIGPSDGQSKVMKGGSFLCHASYCNRYRVAARTSNTPDSSASNIGFRCARQR